MVYKVLLMHRALKEKNVIFLERLYHMKSIIEQASSVAKAIEKGWERSGKPQEFSVKVYEEAQKNFFGMTTKSAKVGLFFEEHATQTARQSKERQPQQRKMQIQPHSTRPAAHVQNPYKERPTTQQPQATVQPRNDKQSTPKKEHTSQSPWSPELTQSAQEWVKDSLNLMGLQHVDFSVDIDRYALRLNFQKPLAENIEREKMLFRSWAYLIMQALRQKYKRPLKGLKIILMSSNA